jgi:hypothetical protein
MLRERSVGRNRRERSVGRNRHGLQRDPIRPSPFSTRVSMHCAGNLQCEPIHPSLSGTLMLIDVTGHLYR